jgi:hypothetical protein
MFGTCFGALFSRWVLSIADIFNPVGVFNGLFYLTFLSLKGINMSAQGIALRNQERFRIGKVHNVILKNGILSVVLHSSQIPNWKT